MLLLLLGAFENIPAGSTAGAFCLQSGPRVEQTPAPACSSERTALPLLGYPLHVCPRRVETHVIISSFCGQAVLLQELPRSTVKTLKRSARKSSWGCRRLPNRKHIQNIHDSGALPQPTVPRPSPCSLQALIRQTGTWCFPRQQGRLSQEHDPPLQALALGCCAPGATGPRGGRSVAIRPGGWGRGCCSAPTAPRMPPESDLPRCPPW